MKHWKNHGGKTIYENPWLMLREYDVTTPSGKAGTYSVIEPKSQAVTVVALDGEERVVLIAEERFPIIKDESHQEESSTLRLPMGGAGHEAESPLAAAQAELKEETGFEASEWEVVGKCAPINGLSTEEAIVYLARGLTQTNENKARQEGIDEALQLLSFDDAVDAMMQRGTVDGQSLAAITMVRRWIARDGKDGEPSAQAALGEDPMDTFSIPVANKDTKLAKLITMQERANPQKPGRALTVAWDKRCPIVPGFVNRYSYIVRFTQKGGMAGNHYHVQKHELYFAAHGSFKIVLEDIDTKVREEHTLSEGDNTFLYVRPRCAHAVISSSSEDALLVIASSPEKASDEFAYPVVSPN